ncbi:MAG: VanZ family protein [Pyrinomonadaceae bacterium]
MSETLSRKNKRRERCCRYAPLLLWAGVVLFASTGSASMAQTSRFIRPFLEFIFPNASDETLQIYHAYIRKSAHFIEYGILAFWASRAFANSAKPILQKYWFIVSFLLVLTVASIDETNQSFNPSRTGSPRDVLLDCAGGAFMILLFAIFRIATKNHKRFSRE